MSDFWKNWLNLWCIFVIGFGALLAAAAFPVSDGMARLVFALFNNPLPDVLGPLERFSIGLMGAVTLGWGMTFYAAFQAAYALEASAAARIWRSITIAAVVWYVVDSFISISTGFALNAVSNTLFLIGYFLPILRSGVMVSR